MPELRFRRDSTFTIVQFTDLHWRNGDHLDRRTGALMKSVLDAERPDMVVLTGDVIDGSECSDPADAWRDAVAPIEDREIAWAAVFGNHDDEGSLSREQLMNVQRDCTYCLSQRGPTDLPGVGNYVLNVLGSSSDSIAASLYFFDSGGPSPDSDDEYAWITPQQIDWYRSVAGCKPGAGGPTSAIVQSGNLAPPSLVFFHIPLPEFDEMSRRHGWHGNKLEGVCCPKVNSGLFSTLSCTGNVLGVFVGHDHLNDFEVTVDGIRLCYGRSTGYGGYGRDDFPRGSRVICLVETARDFRSWIRLEAGKVQIERYC